MLKSNLLKPGDIVDSTAKGGLCQKQRHSCDKTYHANDSQFLILPDLERMKSPPDTEIGKATQMKSPL